MKIVANFRATYKGLRGIFPKQVEALFEDLIISGIAMSNGFVWIVLLLGDEDELGADERKAFRGSVAKIGVTVQQIDAEFRKILAVEKNE
jgi:hypothetical protein